MKNKILSIVYALLVWLLGVFFYVSSYSLPILNNPDLQANIVIILAIIPSACLGTFLFYKKGKMKPSSLGLTFALTAMLLDILITVPVFIIPAGGSYTTFLKDPVFYTVMVEYYFIVFYYGQHLTQKNKA